MPCTHPQPHSPWTTSPRCSPPAQTWGHGVTCLACLHSLGPSSQDTPDHLLFQDAPPHKGSGVQGEGQRLTRVASLKGPCFPTPESWGPRAPAQRSLLSHKHTEPLALGPTYNTSSVSSHFAALRRADSIWGQGGQGNGKVREPRDHHSQELWSWLLCPNAQCPPRLNGRLPSEGRPSSSPEGKGQLCGAPDVCGTIGCHQEQSAGWKCAAFFVRGPHYFMSCRNYSPGAGGCQR